MTFTIEQLESYVKAIDLYESDEAQWLRDKRLEQGGLIARVNPEMTKIVLAVDEAKAELAAGSVEIARQLIAAEAKLQKVLNSIECLRTECLDSVNAAENNARNAHNREALEAVAYTDRDTADAITRILEETK